MLMKCVHTRSATTQHAAEVLSGVPLGAIITTALKRGGKHLALPSVLHKSNPLQSNGPQIQRDGQFVAVVYRRRTSSRKPHWNAATLQYGTVPVDVLEENQLTRLGVTTQGAQQWARCSTYMSVSVHRCLMSVLLPAVISKFRELAGEGGLSASLIYEDVHFSVGCKHLPI